MKRLSIQKKNLPVLAALTVFTVLRSFFVFDYSKTGLILSNEFFMNFGVNLTFDVLTVIFCFVFSFLLLRTYECLGKDVVPLLILIAADPKFSVFQANIFELTVGLLMLITILIITEANEKICNITFFVFCGLCGMVLPMSLFCNIPIVCAVYYFNQNEKNRRPLFAFIGIIVFAVFSIIRFIIYGKNQLTFDTFMNNYSDGFDFSVSVGHTFYNKDIAVYALTVLAVILLIYGIIRKEKLYISKKKFNTVFKNDILFVSVLFIISVFGEIIYHKFSVCYLLLLIVLLQLIKSEDRFALEIQKNLNDFVSRYFFVFLFVLIVLASLCNGINGMSQLFKTTGFDFIK